MLSRFRAMLPAAVKRPLRPLADAWRRSRRRAALRRGIAGLRAQAASGEVSPALLAELHRAWGNTGYSADVSFLAAMVARVLAGGERWLECGSGLSTVVLGAVAGVNGGTLWSLEQDAAWHALVAEDLRMLELPNVLLWHTPLRSFDGFVWYDLGDRALPPAFAAVFCDGPSVGASRWSTELHAAWRVGVVPLLRERGVQFGEILLDDADDGRSAALRRRWAEAGLVTEEILTQTGGFIRGIGTPPKPSGGN